MVGALPYYPRKKQISTQKALKILRKTGQMDEDFSTLTLTGKSYRICLCNSGITATYFFLMQIVFVTLIVVSINDQLSRMGLTSMSDSYTDMIIWVSYLAPVLASMCLITKKKTLQQFLDSWILFPTIQLNLQHTQTPNGLKLDVPNGRKINGSQWAYSKKLFRWLLLGYFVKALSLIPTFNYGGTSEAFISLIQEFRSEQNAVLYMALASVIGDRTKIFNSALKEVLYYLPAVSYNMVVMLQFYSLGEKLKDELDEPKTTLECAKPPNLETVKQAEKFHMVVAEPFSFTAGTIAEFSIQGLWQDAQFQFTVVTVMVQLYESS
ncbi:hypothetical protein FHG87_006585 [Trinorchestia longiramus]|nr:hypothetical protein FHG87_006585 [Trinorchestia longiramus]